MAGHMFTQTALFADSKIELEGSHLVSACMTQRGWGEGGTHVGGNRDGSFYKLGGILDKLRSFGTNPESIYVVFFSKKTEKWFHIGSEIKYSNKIQTVAI